MSIDSKPIARNPVARSIEAGMDLAEFLPESLRSLENPQKDRAFNIFTYHREML